MNTIIIYEKTHFVNEFTHIMVKYFHVRDKVKRIENGKRNNAKETCRNSRLPSIDDNALGKRRVRADRDGNKESRGIFRRFRGFSARIAKLLTKSRVRL